MFQSFAKLFAARTAAATKAARRSLRVEALEDRSVPAVVVQAVGDTLQITGDDTANTVTIYQTDSTVSVSVLNEQSYSSPMLLRDKIVIDLKGGNDVVRYSFGDASDLSLSYAKSLTVNLGSGDDVAELNFGDSSADFQKQINAPVAVAVDGGAGLDRLTAIFGRFRYGSLNLTANMGAGNDTASVSLQGDVTNQSTIAVRLNGQADVDTLFVETKNRSPLDGGGDGIFQQGTDCPIDLALWGGDGNDVVRANLDGEFNDVVNLTAHGDGGRYDAGSDRVQALMTLRNGSYGWINASAYGGAGTDFLQLDYSGAGLSQAKKNLLVDGGTGYDYLVLSFYANLFPQVNCEDTCGSIWYNPNLVPLS